MLVPLVAVGSHVEIQANLTNTRLYQTVAESATLMAFDDVKSAKLCNVYEGEGVCLRLFDADVR